jgi:twinkle protein
MSNFIEWDLIDVKGKTKGVKKTTCPSCSAERKKKTDPCLYVNLDSGVAKCFNCGVLSFRDSVEYETKKEFDLPPPDWSNYTKLSDNMVKWLESRRISQNTAIALNITEEKRFMPQTKKEENCIVFNYFEGSILVNKKFRDARKNFTQSKNTKSIFYNINSILGQDECYIVEGEFDVLGIVRNWH